MNNSGKNSKFITICIIGLFLILSYSLVKSFFNDGTSKGVAFSKDGSFNFIYDVSLLSKENLEAKYDSNRTNEVVINMNYSKTTGDNYKGKLLLNPSNIDYYFINSVDNPKYYKLSLKDIKYLNLYSLNQKDNVISFAILGSDLKYYTMNIYVGLKDDKMDLSDKEWKENGKSNLSIYPNTFYKVIDDKVAIHLELPSVYNESKITESIYEELKNKIMNSISVEETKEFNTNYANLDNKNIKLNDNATLLVKDTNIIQYYSTTDKTSGLSFTTATYIKDNSLISFSELDDKDKFESYIKSNNYKLKDYNYNGISTMLIYDDNSISSDGIKYDSFVFNINDTYYLIGSLTNKETINDNNIDTWISNIINGILKIK